MDANPAATDDRADRLLVAHGDAAVRRTLREPLEGAGHVVVEAPDAAAVLAALAVLPVRLVLSDAGMRDRGGRTLALAVRDASGAEAAVIALVRPGDETAALAAIDDGADDHLILPAAPADLLLRVSACLRGGRRRAAREQAALRRIAEAVAREAAPQDLVDLVAEEIALVHEAAGAAVVRFDDGEATFVGRWSRRPDPWPRQELTVPLTTPLTDSGRLRRGPGSDDFRAFARAVPWILDRDVFGSSVSAPVRVRDRVWGAVVVATEGPDPLPPGTEGRLSRFADLVALAIGTGEVRAELAWRAATDPLTGLVNRHVFEERLAEEVSRSRRHGRDLALAVLDLDDFKQVNDTHGHVTGDAVLREAAARLSALAREGDVIGRLGGEEFGWLMPETDGMEAWQAAERARAAIAGAAFSEAGRVTTSAGVCELMRADGPLDLYRRADAALYWAKRSGRDAVFLYSPEAMEALSGEERAAEVRRNQALASIRVLARAVDSKDPSTRRHSERVAGLAASIATVLGWDRYRVARLRESALVHDVGKIAISDALLFKPERLTPDEMARVAVHAALGAEMVSGVLSPEQASWVRGHHERWDGAGYPDGLAGEAVPEGALILHLADAWDVMTSTRPYVAPMSPADAVRECRRQAGAQFWARAVAALEELHEVGALDAGALERRGTSGRLAV